MTVAGTRVLYLLCLTFVLGGLAYFVLLGLLHR